MGLDNFGLSLGSATAFYLLYTYVRLSCHLQPRGQRLTVRQKIEWDNRVVSTVHSLVTTGGAFVCLYESLSYTPMECFFGFAYYPYLFVNIFLGYLFYDLVLTLYYHAHLRDYATIAHHLLFITVSLYVVYNEFFKFPYAWLSVAEGSTPFVNLRWFLAESGQKDSQLYVLNGLTLLVSFFVFRVVSYSYGLWHLWKHRALVLNPPGTPYLVATAVMLLLSHFLNLFWFRKILTGALKVLGGAGAKKRKD